MRRCLGRFSNTALSLTKRSCAGTGRTSGREPQPFFQAMAPSVASSPSPVQASELNSENGGGSRTFMASSASQAVTLPAATEGDNCLAPAELSSERLTIQRSGTKGELPELSTLKFGFAFTDHMLSVNWSHVSGWDSPSIAPVGPLKLHPGSQVLHYGLECFEGMKAYKDKEGRIRLFRPEKNLQRLHRSCTRLCLPAFNQEELLKCMKQLLLVDTDWVPQQDGYSLYLRPTVISTTPSIGVGPPLDAKFFCLLSPTGPFFSDGLTSIRLFIDQKNVRAFPGGMGDFKVGGNYAPTILPQLQAAKLGCSQVLYVLDDGKDGGLIGEAGAMNMFFVFKRKNVPAGEPQLELATPPLDGLILPGVTRDSVLEIARSWEGGKSLLVSERQIRLKEVEDAYEEGRLVEMFSAGTAVIIQPIGELLKADGKIISCPFDKEASSYWTSKPPGSSAEPARPDEPISISGRMFRAISDIQYGHVAFRDWSVIVS
eukprot:TRINITY_DN3747_c0_g1_i3.p1 TRINITY_DN3747_c0_g1~~TRINITY_DN3747_c0_g1_i3.p1  ORF type:complete len:486 (-),score=121.79 TRINITY_DN3747_c0_g1_i3:114-1571(-)